MMNMIDISGLSKASVLVALHNGTSPAGMGFLHATNNFTEAEAEAILTRSTYVDYCAGRPIKCNLSGDEFDPRLYDRDAGQGAAARAIDALRTKAA